MATTTTTERELHPARLDPFQALPLELSLLILQRMQPRSMLLSSLVSRAWHDLAVYEPLWKDLCFEELGRRLGHDMETIVQTKETLDTTWRELYLVHAFHFRESRILTSEQRKLLGSEWLARDVSWKLQFRATRDGFDPAAFHQLCDNRGATITVCLSTKGFVFGGYNPKSWSVGSKDPELKHSPDAFIFSLINPAGKPACRMFPTKDPRSACSSNSSYGPVWGNGYDLGVFGFPNGRGRSAWCRLGATYTAPYPTAEIGNQHYFIGGNPRDFDLAEVEVYVVRRDLGRRRKRMLEREKEKEAKALAKQQQQQQQSATGGWACAACTYLNTGSKIQCAICASVRPAGAKGSRLFVSGGSGAVRVLRNPERTLSSGNIAAGGGTNSGGMARVGSPLVARRGQQSGSALSPVASRRQPSSSALSPAASRRNNNATTSTSTSTSSPNPARRAIPGGGTMVAGRSSDALRRIAEEEGGPAAMVRRMSRERERDREAALAAAMRSVELGEQANKLGEDRRARLMESRRGGGAAAAASTSSPLLPSWSRSRSGLGLVSASGGPSSPRRAREQQLPTHSSADKLGRSHADVSLLPTTTTTTTTRMTLLEKVGSAEKLGADAHDNVDGGQRGHDDGDEVERSAKLGEDRRQRRQQSSSPSEEKKKRKKDKEKEKERKKDKDGRSKSKKDHNNNNNNDDDKKRKQKKKDKKSRQASSSSSSSTLTSSTIRRPAEKMAPDEWKRLNRSVGDISPRSVMSTGSSSSSSSSSSLSSSSSSLHRSEERAVRSGAARSSRSKSPATTNERDDERRAAKRHHGSHNKQSRSASSLSGKSATSALLASGSGEDHRRRRHHHQVASAVDGPSEPAAVEERQKSMGTLRKLISVKPSIQIKKNEVSISLRRRSKSGEKKDNNIRPSDEVSLTPISDA